MNTSVTLPFTDTQLNQLELFCNYIQKNVDVVHDPKLAFFKKFLLDLGCTEISSFKLNIEKEKPEELKRKPIIQEFETHEREEELIIDTELDEELPSHYLSNMGDTFMSTNESQKQAVEAKTKAVQAFKEKNFKKSALLFGRAIYLSGGKFHPLFMKRAECFLELNKYLSARRDSTRSIELESEKNYRAYLVRGKSNFALENWAEANFDFEKALSQLLEEKKSTINNNNEIIINHESELLSFINKLKDKLNPNDKSIYTSSVESKKAKKPTSDAKKLKKKLKKANSNTNTNTNINTSINSNTKTNNTFNSIQSTGLTTGQFDSNKIENIFKDLSEDKDMAKLINSPDLSKALEEISKDPKKLFEYKETNPQYFNFYMKILNSMSKS